MQLPDQLNETPAFKVRARRLYDRYREYGPAAFFFAGFFFDILTLSRIDDPLTMIQQGIYLALLSIFVIAELVEQIRPFVIPRFLSKVWKYRDEIVHFIFGSLLSVYMLFYFKSASFVTSFVFLFALGALMVANEFSRFQQTGIIMRAALLSFSFGSYFAYVIPVLLGFIGLLPFALAMVLNALMMFVVFGLVGRFVNGKVPAPRASELIGELGGGLIGEQISETGPDRATGDAPILKKSKRLSYAMPVIFFALYLVQLIPPVPLSAQYVGIYHQVEKIGASYKLSFDRPWYKIWQNGAQTFLARPGDRVYVFTRVFSPTNFHEQLKVRWAFKDPRQGWIDSDAIPIKISGGRDEGFRGFAFKQNYQPGSWRVRLETSDGREISRIHFEVVPDTNPEPREFKTDTF